MAVFYSRILIVDWCSPVSLEEHLNISKIDWRPTTEEMRMINASKIHRLNGCPSYGCTIGLGNNPFVATGNSPWNTLIKHDFHTYTFHELNTFLFKPSAYLISMLDKTIPTKEYAALHIRMGDRANGSAFASNDVPRRDTRYSFYQSSNLIRSVLKRHKNVFLATDNARLKHHARSLSGVWTIGCDTCMVNAVFRHNFERRYIDNIFLDMFALIRATCFTYATTGKFSAFVESMRRPKKC
jgi:hypothetical protein